MFADSPRERGQLTDDGAALHTLGQQINDLARGEVPDTRSPPCGPYDTATLGRQPHGPARADSRGADLLALLAQLALRPDVPVARHGGDPEFTAECGHGGVAVRHRGLSQPHLGFR